MATLARVRSDLTGQTVLVTGAARGIGAATARELDRRGARLALLDLRAGPLVRLAAELRDAEAYAADVTDEAALGGAIEAAVGRFGGLDAVVAAAGVAPIGSVGALDPAVFERTIEVNLLGVYRTLRLALPHVRARDGYLLAVSSLAAPTHTPLMAHYAASKAGVEALADAMRLEVEHEGVSVGVAYFGWIDTELVREGMSDRSAAALRRRGGRWPLTKDYPAGGAARAVADGIERRARTVAYPGWVRPILVARGLLQPLVEWQLRRAGAAAAVADSDERLRALRAGATVAAEATRGGDMQVIDCDCGVTLQAANEDDLARRVREHLESDHPDMEMDDEQIRSFVAEKSYAASDS